jgi:hypothetical protein
MTLVFAVEASNPNGAVYRLLFGFNFDPLASWFTALGRFF